MAADTSTEYSREEAEAILRLALRRRQKDEGRVDSDDLKTAAADLGLSPSEIEAARSDYEDERKQGKRVARKRQRLISNFIQHLAAFITVNPFLIFIDLRDGSADWFYWPLFGWGIGLVSDAVHVWMKLREFDADAK